MTRVYQILRKACAATPFDGEGAFRYGGRWSSPGIRVAYASEHLSLAMIEYFVPLDLTDPPEDLVVATADIPDSVRRYQVPYSALPKNWRETPAPLELRHIGDEIFRTDRYAALIVPSALAPEEFNWLLDPRHPAFRENVRVNAVQPFRYDPRLFGE